MSGLHTGRGEKSSASSALSKTCRAWVCTENGNRELQSGGTLNAENHFKLDGWRTRRNRHRQTNVRHFVSRAEFGNFGHENISRDASSLVDGSGDTLRPLPEAAAMVFPARHVAGSELQRSRIVSCVDSRAAWQLVMTRGHNMMVSGYMLRHFTRGMDVALVHEQHRGQCYFCPGHHGQKQPRRNGFLQHPVLSMADQ